MTSLKLFHFPGACSRVAMTALEHVGVSFEAMPAFQRALAREAAALQRKQT